MVELSISEKLERIEKLLENQACSTWLPINAATRYSNLSPRTLKRAIDRGELKAVKRNGHWLFRISWIDRYLFFGKQRLNRSEQKELKELS